MNPWGSIRLRLTVWYAGAMATGLLLFAAASFGIIRREINHRADRLLEGAARAFAGELQLEFQMLGNYADALDETMRGVRFRGVTLGALDERLDVLRLPTDDSMHMPPASVVSTADEATRRTVQRAIPQLRAALTHSHAAVTLPDQGPGVRLHLLRVAVGDGSRRVVVAARGRGEDVEALRSAAILFLALVVGALVVAVAGGWLLTRRTLAPIAAISRQARAIGVADLSARVPVTNPHDELGVLARVINDLLQRLQEAFTMQRRFVADASHELRTPLAIVRSEANVALARPEREAAEYRDALGVVQRESERLTALVEDLFLLARADAGGQPMRTEPLYLDDLLRGVAHATRTLAELRRVEVSLAADVDGEFHGDPAMLHRALLNLVDNALKHSRAGGEVRLSLVRTDRWWEIRVADEGLGITPSEQGRIFDRFFRGDVARTRVRDTFTSGAGLGLSIARHIAEAHHGALTLERSTSRGSVFLLALPITASASR